MKRFKKWYGFMMAMLIMILSGGSAYALAETPPTIANGAGEGAGGAGPTGPIDGPGAGGTGPQWQGGSQEIQEDMGNWDYYVAYVNPTVVEMKLESCPIDQILRASKKMTPVDNNRVEYYSIGQRPIMSKLTAKVDKNSTGKSVTLQVENKSAFDTGDIIMVDGYMGYEDGTTRSKMKPLQFRVINCDDSYNPVVYAINGKKGSNYGNRDFEEDIPVGATLLRLGRAAGEKEVETGSYYMMPDKSFQYCQRFIMQVEESLIDRMSKKQVKWDFTRQEKMAMDDMRYGQERSGLFGVKTMTNGGKNVGLTYTMGGIFWEAGKDLQIGHWQPKMEMNEKGQLVPVTVKVTVNTANAVGQKAVDVSEQDAEETEETQANAAQVQETQVVEKQVYEYVIGEKDLTRFIAAILKGAGNASRTKLLFVDNLIYQAFANLRSNKRIITQTEKDYQGWKLDFETFESMGTKILIYRHDAFNSWGMDGRAFCLDARYLDKYVFGVWSRNEFNAKDLLIRNTHGVVMEEYSCWVLTFPDAHARVSRPTFDVEGAVSDEQIAA